MISSYFKNLSRRRITLTDNGFGGQTESVATATIKGIIDRDTNTGTQTAGKFQPQLKPTLYVSATTDITTDDEIVDGTITYKIVNMPDNVMERGHHLESELEALPKTP